MHDLHNFFRFSLQGLVCISGAGWVYLIIGN